MALERTFRQEFRDSGQDKRFSHKSAPELTPARSRRLKIFSAAMRTAAVYPVHAHYLRGMDEFLAKRTGIPEGFLVKRRSSIPWHVARLCETKAKTQGSSCGSILDHKRLRKDGAR
jgi:hypothetical protein